VADAAAIRALLDADSPLARPRKSLAEEAADALHNLILLEKLAPGAAIPERELAEALGISRTPLRDAMHLLAIEGLVEYSATRRPRVANPSIEELTQNLAVLGALEALAGQEACAHATDAEIARAVAARCASTTKSSPPWSAATPSPAPPRCASI